MAPLSASSASLASGFGTLDLSIDQPYTTAPQPLAPITDSVDGSGLEFELPAFSPKQKSGPILGELEDFKNEAAVSFGTTVSGPLATFAPKVAEPAPDHGGMLEFDLGSIMMDLNDPAVGTSSAQSTIQDDPLATKLSLAEEFNIIGDEDGARALIEEVIAEASGEMRTRAQAALAQLS